MDDNGVTVKCTVCKTTSAAPRLFPCGHVVCAKCLAHIISNSYEENGSPKPSKQTQCPTCLRSFDVPSSAFERLPLTGQPSTRTTNSPTESKAFAAAESRTESALAGAAADGISFTESSKDMLADGGHGSGGRRPNDDSSEGDPASDDSRNAATDESTRRTELPVIDAVIRPSEVFATSRSMDLGGDSGDEGKTKNASFDEPTADRFTARHDPPSTAAGDKAFDDTDGPTSEGSSGYPDEEEEAQSSVSSASASSSAADVNNLCSVCRLTQRYVAASTYCVSCGCLLCAGCTRAHRRHGPDREHVLAPLGDDGLRAVICRWHDQLVRYFCLACCTPVCKACLAERHGQHRMTDFVSSPRPDGVVRQLASHVGAVLKELLARKRGLAKAYEAAELNRRETNTSIIRSIDGQIQSLQERRQRLIDDSDRFHGKVKERLDAVERQVDRAIVLMKDIQLKVDTSTCPLPPHSHVVPAVQPTAVIERLFSAVALPVLDYRDFGATDCRYVPGSIPDPGKLVVGLAVSESELTEVDSSNDRRSYRVKVIWNKAVAARDAHFLPGSKDLVFTDVSKGHTIHKLNCDGKLAPLMVGLAGFAGRRCSFGLNRYTGYKAIGYKPETRASDVVLALFDGGSDQVDVDVDLVGATLPPGYGALVGLTVTLRGLVVALLADGEEENDPTRTSICCFDREGHLLWQRNTSPSSLAGDLVEPRFVAVDKLDRLIVSDRKGGKVNIYTCDGSYVLSFPSLEEGRPKVMPTGICLDSGGRILVAFYDLNVVSLFTANGNFIRHVVQTIGPPLAISLCDEDKYLVVAIEDHGLWLYSLLDFD